MRRVVLIACLLPVLAWGQGAPRTPNLALKFTRDTTTNDNFVRLDDVLGTITDYPHAGVVDRGGQVYNVKAYGATGDGTTDDTTAIQRAIDAASGGGTIYFPGPATYLISDALIYSSDQRFQGSADATVKLKASSVANLVGSLSGTTVIGMFQPSALSGASNVEFVDMRIDGNKVNNSTSNSGIGIELLNCQNCAVRGGYITGTPHNGIAITESSGQTTSNVTVEGVTIYDVGLSGVNGGSGIAVVAGDNIQILDVYVSSSERDGIDVEPNAGRTVRGLTIRGGMYRDNTLSGVSVLPTASGDLSIAELTISDVQSHSNTRAGFSIGDSTGYRVEGLTVRGCTAYRNGREGFAFVDQESVALVGNYAIENGQASANTYSGFKVDRANFSVEGNQAWEAQSSKTQKYGFEEASDGTGNVFVGNVATAHATSRFYIQGAAYNTPTAFTTGDTAVWTHIYSANASINFDNIVSPPDCNDKTITVTGAADGDRVIVGLRNGAVVADGFVTGWVSAADTVTVRLCVLTGTNVDAAAAFMRVDVIKQ